MVIIGFLGGRILQHKLRNRIIGLPGLAGLPDVDTMINVISAMPN
jgi:hypothetical protein